MKFKPQLKGLGFKPDLPDIRDYSFTSVAFLKRTDLPTKIDHRLHIDMPPIYDQGSLGSCTANSVGALCDFEYGSSFIYDPSRLFLYYVTRSLEGTVESDAGATIRNTIKAANEFGVATENWWPYLIKKFKDTPPTNVFDMASNHQALEYKRVAQRLDDLRSCLAEENLIAFGFTVYDSLYEVTKSKPILPQPNYNESMLGGHAVVLVGYDDDKELFLVRNSWGTEFGEDGYFYMPYDFVLNRQYCMDFWTISLMEK